LPLVGETVTKGDWQTTVIAFGPPERLALLGSNYSDQHKEEIGLAIARMIQGRSRGKVVSVRFNAKNVGKQPVQVTQSDLRIIDGSGREFSPLNISHGSMPSVLSGRQNEYIRENTYFAQLLTLAATVQPGCALTSDDSKMITFDLDPAATGLKFRFFETQFRLTD